MRFSVGDEPVTVQDQDPSNEVRRIRAHFVEQVEEDVGSLCIGGYFEGRSYPLCSIVSSVSISSRPSPTRFLLNL